MSSRYLSRCCALALVLLLGARSASAQWAVIDVGAIAQLVEQYKLLQEQLTTARDHLQQARDEYEALTGGRGMEQLLSGIARNYLPADWQALEAALNGAGGGFGPLSASTQAHIRSNAILSEDSLARLSPIDQKHVAALRRTTAGLQALSQQALGANSARFEVLQELIDAIADAEDPKAILDLQARIAAEQAMVANDANKLESLFESMQAEQAAERLRRREQAIADIGAFRDLPPLGL